MTGKTGSLLPYFYTLFQGNTVKKGYNNTAERTARLESLAKIKYRQRYEQECTHTNQSMDTKM